MHKKVERRLHKWSNADIELHQFQAINIDSFHIKLKEKQINIYFKPDLAYLPIRETDSQNLYLTLSNKLGRKLGKYNISIFTNHFLVQDLVPNWNRKNLTPDTKRMPVATGTRIPIVQKKDQPAPAQGLYNSNLVLWNSHGFFYESNLDRWEYQRPRLFGTVEDLNPTTYVLQYLVPMFENAGAEVFLPRERDTQLHEVIVDNDISTGNSEFLFSRSINYSKVSKGFAPIDTLFPGVNPFEHGTSLRFNETSNGNDSLIYLPEIPQKGKYAVYVSYLRDSLNSSAAEYVVRHSGGETSFLVNQKIGGSTWVYLGSFDFGSGKNLQSGSVVLKIKGNTKEVISADAVRFGGGMGNVARRPADGSGARKGLSTKGQDSTISDSYLWKLSGKPRYMEAARYSLQYNGAPDSIVYNLNKNKNDYTDDLQSRGEWVNYLIGKSKPQYKSSFDNGLNIPIDLSLAFHTDAGITSNDSVIGTLGIYSTEKNNGIFPDGQSKLTSRDLTDIVQTQVVDDIRKLYKSDWTRRAMWDKGYSEAFRPIVPAMLLELLSHQNLADMRLGLDPRFRFTVSRAIYKGVLKYLAFQQNRPYVVQPLPVDHFSITALGNKTIKLNWKPVMDSLEVSANPVKFKIYKRIGDTGFDNGTIVTDTSFQITLDNYNQIYSFKITALNEGGESFPSEILSAGFKNESASTLLIVNAFDRVCAPASFDAGNKAGIAWWQDQGVPFHSEIGFCGNQYDYNRKSDWKDDDSPGWGASYADMEGKIIPGNTFDYPYKHGESIMANGYSFVSVSDEVFSNKYYDVSPYSIVDVILGEEKSTSAFKKGGSLDFQIYTPSFRDKLKEVTDKGNSLFLSGAYVGSDLLTSTDSASIKFAKNVLHFKWRSDHAVKNGDVYATDDASSFFKGQLYFNTSYNPDIYTVEAPDAIEPEGKRAYTVFRYRENNSSAGVAYLGNYKTLIFGFPFETIAGKQERTDFMFQVLNFLKK